MRSLRLRFVLSHVLPLLIVIPLMGVILIYGIETRILIPELLRELKVEAKLVDTILKGEGDFKLDQAQAHTFIEEVSPDLSSRIMFFNREGQLLASSDPKDDDRIGEKVDNPTLQNALQGIATEQQSYSPNLDAEIADIWYPVLGSEGRVLGVFRLSHRLVSALEGFVNVRYTIGAFVLGSLIVGIGLGWILSEGLSRPINKVVVETRKLAAGLSPNRLAVHGSMETRLLIETFNSMVERLERAEKERRQLIANLVHELGRPLGAMGSAVHSLMIGAWEDEKLRHEMLSGISAQIKGLGLLLDDLALLHKQVLGEIDLELQEVDMNLWFPQIISPWREAAQEKGIHWRYAQDDRLPTMTIDPGRLDQALGNLLANAIKFTHKGGEIKVAAGLKNAGLFISVRDTGTGITPEEMSEIFTPFYRGFSGQRFPEGMGLGLSIARDIVVAHGGKIEVQSTLGEGSEFTIQLPLNNDLPSISSPEPE